MPRSIDDILSEIVNNLEKKHFLKKIDKIILFGSRARGDADERSDIDIAVSSTSLSQKEWLDTLDIIMDINTLLELDVVRLEDAPEALRNNILTEGTLIHEREKN